MTAKLLSTMSGSIFLSIITFLYLTPTAVHGCSRILWSKYSDVTVLSGRSMDWIHSFEDYLFAVPRGVPMDGGAGAASATWTSKYGSVYSSIIGYAQKHGFVFEKDGATDGINEMGLGMHLLYLEATEYPNVGEGGKKAVTYMRWGRYVLDNFATVAEAVEAMKEVNVVAVELGGHVLGGHMAIEDPSGDSAVFEIIAGKMQIYHGKDVLVMTNDPPYDEQLELLSHYEGFGGNLPLPGSVSSEDRFVRLSYYLPYLPEPEDDVEGVGYLQSLVMNTAVPFGAPYKGDVYPTWWTSYSDLTNMVYYFNWIQNPFLIWIEFKNIDFSPGGKVLALNPRDPSLLGEVSSMFKEPGVKEERRVTAKKHNSFTAIIALIGSAVSIFAIKMTSKKRNRTDVALSPITEESSLLT